MFFVNQSGRIVDLPHRMEKAGFHQAREILSISEELMNCQPTGVTMSDEDARQLRDNILKKFPEVITDSEYMEKSNWKDKFSNMKEAKIKEIKGEIEETKEEIREIKENLVNAEMTKNEIVDIASQNGVKLNSKELKFVKAKLVEIVNERYSR